MPERHGNAAFRLQTPDETGTSEYTRTASPKRPLKNTPLWTRSYVVECSLFEPESVVQSKF